MKNKFSNMIRQFAAGGNLVPVANNVQMVQGDTHQQDTDGDGMTGVILQDGQGNPYAEVEDQEAIVDGNKVVSNKITDEQGQSLAKKVQQLGMIKDTLSQEIEMLKMAKAEYDDLKNKSGSRYDTGEINRELEDLEPRIIMLQESINDIDGQIQEVFMQQEMMKEQMGMQEQGMQSQDMAQNGSFPVQGENLNESSGVPQFYLGGDLPPDSYLESSLDPFGIFNFNSNNSGRNYLTTIPDFQKRLDAGLNQSQNEILIKNNRTNEILSPKGEQSLKMPNISGIPSNVTKIFLDKKYYPSSNPHSVNPPLNPPESYAFNSTYQNNYGVQDVNIDKPINKSYGFNNPSEQIVLSGLTNEDVQNKSMKPQGSFSKGEQPTTAKKGITSNQIQAGVDIAAHALPFIDAIAARRAVKKTPKYQQPLLSRTPQINTDYDISAQTASLNNSRDLALQNIDNTVNNSQVAAAMKMKVINDYNTQVNNLQSQKVNAENQLRNQQTMLSSNTARENNQLLMASNDRETQRQAGMLLDNRKIGANLTDKMLSMYDNERMRRFQNRQLDLESKRYKDSGTYLNTLSTSELEKEIKTMDKNSPYYSYAIAEYNRRKSKNI
jgi:hypothetical protein